MTDKTISTTEVTKRPIYVQPHQIQRKPGFNPRFDFGDLSEIKDSMKANGFMAHKPLLVQKANGEKTKDGLDLYWLVDGDRRFTSVEELVKSGFSFEDGIPVAVADRAMTDTDLRVLAYTSNSGKPFLPLEEAALIKKLKDDGLSIKEICRRLAKHPPQVQAALALVEADDSVKEAVASGKIGATLGREIAKKAKGDKAKQKDLVEKASQGKQGKKVVKEEVERTSSPNARRRLNKPEKVKPLGQAQLEEQQDKLYGQFVEAASAEGLGDIDAMLAACGKDGKLSAAFYLGAYLATKAAAGEKVKISV